MSKSKRIEALIAQMTVEEKVGQLGIFADALRPFAPDINPEANMQGAADVREGIRKGRIGALFNGVGAAQGREAQRIAVEESRLGIPLLLGADVIHGMRTVFPIPLGEAASFEPDLAHRTARAAAIEATAAGIHWTFAPAVDIARDQRWGRGAEGAGEDVLLGCVFASARVQGFQGEAGLAADDCLLATPKHFAAYGAVAGGLEYSTVDISEQTLRDVHLPPFQSAFEAGAITVMTAFNDINGVPASANRWLMTELLRHDWQFPGLVVSDYTADMELIAHGYATDERDATCRAFTAGLDVSMQSGFYERHLASLVKSGEVTMEQLDASVRRVLWVKEKIGLFDHPYRSLDPQREADQSHLAAHEELARDAARRSIVLLKNQSDVLPLKTDGQKIALIGPFARDRNNIEGCWTLFGDKARYVTLEEGFRAALKNGTQLRVEDGCGLEDAIDGGIEAAITAAQASDIVVLAIGEPQHYSGEAQSRTQIVVPAAHQALAEALAATGKPMVVLLRNGRALALHGAVRNAAAIVVTWYLGSQTGHGVADVLFGRYNPAGCLPVSFPQDSGQEPLFYNRTRTGRPELPGASEFKSRWREVTADALYPFGHGLSYTTFDYGLPQLSSTQLAWDDKLIITSTVTNTGKVAGETVVQLYVHDRVASRVRPVRELKAFRKIALKAGESAQVDFHLHRNQLAFTGTDLCLSAEPGWFDVWASDSSVNGVAVSFELLPSGA